MPTSRQQTNIDKRNEMKDLMTAVLAKGWTHAQLAALFRLSATAIKYYAKGHSMGTNELRMTLAVLRKPAEERKRIEKTIERCKEIVEAKREDLEKKAADKAYIRNTPAEVLTNYANSQMRDVDLEIKRVDILTALL